MEPIEILFSGRLVLTHSSGLFASRDELHDKVMAELDSAQPTGTIDCDAGGEYEVSEFEVEVSAPPKQQRRPRAGKRQTS